VPEAVRESVQVRGDDHLVDSRSLDVVVFSSAPISLGSDLVIDVHRIWAFEKLTNTSPFIEDETESPPPISFGESQGAGPADRTYGI
jgi:hypothetical protein